MDVPTNVRRAPNGQAAIACRLPRNGLRLLVVPLRPHASGQASPWLATTVCRSGAQRAAIGLGLAPDYIHRSQLRLLEANPDDWLEDPTGQSAAPAPRSGISPRRSRDLLRERALHQLRHLLAVGSAALRPGAQWRCRPRLALV